MNEIKIMEELKTALKGGDKVKVSVIRMLISEIKNKKIAEKVKELNDDQILGIMRKTIKKHEESIDQFGKAGREDLVEKETREANILKGYMPEEMSEEEISKIVAQEIEEVDAKSMKDMGRVIKAVLDKTSGRADGKIVSVLVKNKLA
ncbi:MAG: GatB/YqeY domain-containing protein [Candidatus Omnitrophota bacterium]